MENIYTIFGEHTLMIFIRVRKLSNISNYNHLFTYCKSGDDLKCMQNNCLQLRKENDGLIQSYGESEENLAQHKMFVIILSVIDRLSTTYTYNWWPESKQKCFWTNIWNSSMMNIQFDLMPEIWDEYRYEHEPIFFLLKIDLNILHKLMFWFGKKCLHSNNNKKINQLFTELNWQT